MEFITQFKNYLFSQKKTPSKITIKNYISDVKKFVLWYEQTFNLSFIPSSISPQIIGLFKKGYSNDLSIKSINRYLSSLRRFFSFLLYQKEITVNPLETPQKESQSKELDPFYLKNFKNYLYVADASSLTIKNYLNDIKQFLSWADKVTEAKAEWEIKNENIFEKLNSYLVEEYKNRLSENNFSPVTINRKLSSIRKYLYWCSSEGIVKPSEINNLDLIKYSSSLISKPNTLKPTISLESNIPTIIQPSEKEYSRIPPIRLGQKTIMAINSAIDISIVNPVVKAIDEVQYVFWKLKRKPVFTSAISNLSGKRPKTSSDINLGFSSSNISKSLYAPHSVSIKHLSWYKRLTHHLRHTRPKWYKSYHYYPVVHYLHFAILIIFASALGFGIYQALFQNPINNKQFVKAQAPGQAKILSFREKLTDSSGNPISTETTLRFAIYNDPKASGSALLWEEINTVKPNTDGEFTVNLGTKTEISQNLFTQNSSLWLGVSIENAEELIPRQKIANSELASDANTLAGLNLITNSGNEPLDSNTILALDSSGNLSIGGEIPHTFQAINSKLTLSGNTLSLSTILGTNSDVQLSPDGMGMIDLQKPIQNSTNNNNISGVPGSVEVDDLFAIFATSSAQSAFTINQNDIGPLISASASGIAKFTVDNSGNTTIAGDIFLSGTNPGVTTLYDTGLSISARDKGELTLQSISSGNIQFFSAANTFSSDGNLRMAGSLTLSDPSAESSFTGNVAIGSTDPSYRLDVQDSQTSTSAARIYNSSISNDASGLIIKLGNTSTSTHATNKWLTFEQDGIGIVGMIKGNGSTGIQYQTGGIADFAEYLRKDENQKIDFGSVLCLEENGFATPCTKEGGKIVGVASERPSFLGGENLGNKSVPAGLIGEIITKVSNVNGPINTGDLLTSSQIPGYAMKATKEGTAIGRALQSFNPSSCPMLNPPSDNFGLIDEVSKACKGEILVLLNIGYHNPNPPIITALTNSISKIDEFTKIAIDNLEIKVIKAGEITTDSLAVTTNSLFINGQNLKNYITDLIAQSNLNQNNEIISPIVRTNELYVNIISPLSKESDLVIKLASSSANQNTAFIIKNSSGSAVATINSNGDASLSGKLSASGIETSRLDSTDASISGVLRVNKIIADQIESLGSQKSASSESHLNREDLSISRLTDRIALENISDSFFNISTFSARLAHIDDLKTTTASFTQGFISLGPASLSNISVTGQLSVDSNLILANRSINVLGSDLELQPLRQGGISIMAGMLYIDTDGNLKINGNAEFAKDVTVGGTFSANIIAPIPNQDVVVALKATGNRSSPSFSVHNASNSAVLSINQLGDILASGSGTFSKLNLSLVQPALAISNTEAIATGSAGIASINAGQKEITIYNKSITDKSLIYITPKADTYNLVLYLIRQVPGISFTVGINAPLYKDIQFNWFIVN